MNVVHDLGFMALRCMHGILISLIYVSRSVGGPLRLMSALQTKLDWIMLTL